MKKLLCACVFLGLVLVVRADDFEDGNRAYEAGDFRAAITAYEKAASAGGGSNVFFNLGNALFRADEKGRAILNFERALALEPGHPEATANLAFVRRNTAAIVERHADWLQPFARLGTNGLTLAVCTGFWLIVGGVLLLAGPTHRTPAKALLAGGCILALMSGTARGLLHGGEKDPSRAVILADEGAKILYAPAENARVVATLPAGSEVRVLQDRDDWLYTELPDGARGWCARANLERVLLASRY